MKSNDSPIREELRKKFLEEGAKSYFTAINALTVYREEIHKICRSALKKHLGEYGSALQVRVPFADNEIKDINTTDEDDFCIGVKIVRDSFPRAKDTWECWCYLAHGPGEEPSHGTDASSLCYFVYEWFSSRTSAEDVYQLFHKLNKDVQTDGKDLWIGENLNPHEICELENRLGAMVEKWIGYWTKVGGIKSVFQE
jgi:hypothetical protein